MVGRSRRTSFALALALGAGLAVSASAAAPTSASGPAPVVHPKLGTPVRQAIMDALRRPVSRALHQPVQFVVGKGLAVSGDWAFLQGRVVDRHGRRIDFHHTRWQAQVDAGAFDDNVFALFRRRPGKGWMVVTYRIGCTDVCWLGWAERYHAPAALFR